MQRRLFSLMQDKGQGRLNNGSLPANTVTVTASIDPLKPDAQTAPVLHAVLTQHHRTIFPSFYFAQTYKLNNKDTFVFIGTYTANNTETSYRADLQQPVVKFQRKKNPAEYRYTVLGAVLGEGTQGAVYECIATIKLADHDVIIKLKNNRIVKLMRPLPLKLSHTLTRDAAQHEYLLMQRASDIYNPRNMMIDNTINMHALMSSRFPGVDMLKFLIKAQDNVNFTFEKRVRLALLSIAALKKIHERKIVHRDIKLENILVEADDDNNTLNAWLIDLGLGKEDELDTTDSPGSPAYASPEAHKNQAINSPADVFSLGRTFWQLFGDLAVIVPYLHRKNNENTQHLSAGMMPTMDDFFRKTNYTINKEARDALYALFVHMNTTKPSARATVDECSTALTQIACNHIPDFAISKAKQQLTTAVVSVSPSMAITSQERDESEQAAAARNSYNPRLYGPASSTATAAAAASTDAAPRLNTSTRK